MAQLEITPGKLAVPAIPRRPRRFSFTRMFCAVVVASTLVLSLMAILELTADPDPTVAYVMYPSTDYALLRGMLRNARVLGPWQSGQSVTAPDDHVYSYIESSFLQGQTLAIGRDEGAAWLYRRFKLVGETNGDSPRLWIPLVRPAGVNDNEYGQLYCSDFGVVVGLRYDNHCCMAYDTRTEQFFGQPSNKEPGEKITSISPFILIGPETKLHQSDVARLVQAATGDPTRTEGVVSEAALQEALDHPNPEVRKLARRILDSMVKRDGKEG
jgi:hypothetical protein